MKTLLHHIDLISRCRRRSDAEAAVVFGLNQILGAERTELHKLIMPMGDVLVGLAAEVAAGMDAPITHDDGFSWPLRTSSIESQPQLQACFGSDAPSVESLPGGKARMAVQLKNDRRDPYGFLVITRGTPLSDAEMTVLHGVATLLKNQLSLLDYSETDTLTRLLNRKTFDEYFVSILARIPEQEDSRSGALHLPRRRHQHAEARDHWLGVMDIDHFKSINDRFGHLMGDEVLLRMADQMRECFRSQDKLFRFGGEEFVALLRPAEYRHAWHTFERFRSRVESFDFPLVGKVTVSIGFTRITSGDTPPQILDNADQALYWAKEHGRNQCHAYETLLAGGKVKEVVAPASEVELF